MLNYCSSPLLPLHFLHDATRDHRAEQEAVEEEDGGCGEGGGAGRRGIRGSRLGHRKREIAQSHDFRAMTFFCHGQVDADLLDTLKCCLARLEHFK